MATPSGSYRPSPILLGAVLGGLVGAGEVIAGMLTPGSAITRQYLLEAALLYGAAGALAGAVLWIASRWLAHRDPAGTTSAAVLLGFFAFLLVAGTINVRYLPEAFARSSLLYTGLILVACAGATWLLRRGLASLPIARWMRQRAVRGGMWVILAAGGLALVVASLLPAAGTTVRVENPGAGLSRNVVLIVLDALRYDHLSQNGYARETTPQLDALAAEGVVFENAQAQAPWTKPSTATILTSLYPSTHGVNPMASAVPPSVALLPEMLRRYGFRTAVFTANYFITPEFGFDRGTEHFYSSRAPRLPQLMLGHLLALTGDRVRPLGTIVEALVKLERTTRGGGAPAGGLSAEGLVRAFWTWSHGIGNDRFFAYLHFMEPHAPYNPPAPYDRLFMPEHLVGRPKVINFPEFTGFLPFDPGRPASADSLASMIALYDGGIRLADYWVGELVRDLKQRGLFENTLILVTADHGEEFYDHGGWGHGQSLYEELLHVPLILCGPEMEPARSRRLPNVVRHVDLVPTILDVCGLPVPEELAGQSLLPIVRGEEPEEPARPVYSEVDFGGHGARSLREGGRKVIRAQRGADGRRFAFDLAADPGEQEDLVTGAAPWPAEMFPRLDEFHASAARNAAPGVSITIDEATRERLRAIGYLK